ncbi:6-bladed beta-propeller [Algoriphagus litoralis]|uniref:6-bladed beta-propeller n=1 Tax=Algoriphagus litoralis TaxID=2202829 RepID=UPI0013002A18|nr:6-bladed beta-propeller [Algoriphagus litoralis]
MNRWFILFLSLIFFSCEEKDSSFSFQPIQANKPLLVGEIGESLEIIEIQTKYPISGTPTILKSDKYFYLFEEGIVTTLHQIGLDGNVRKSIDFGFDDKLNADGITQVILIENGVGVISRGTSIIWFDENLEERETEKLPFKAHFHFPITDGQIISFNNRIDDQEDYDILINQNGDLKKSLPIRKDEYNYVYKSYSSFSKWNDKVLFSQAFNDTIYVLDQEGFRPLFHVDFGSNAVADRLIQIQHPLDMLAFFNEKKYHYLPGEVYGIDIHRILFQINEKGTRKVGLLDFQSDELTVYPGIVDNSISNMILYFPQISVDGELYFGISGEQILENYDRIPDSFKHRLSTDYAESYFIYRLKIKPR